jgi:hypothetical protein
VIIGSWSMSSDEIGQKASMGRLSSSNLLAMFSKGSVDVDLTTTLEISCEVEISWSFSALELYNRYLYFYLQLCKYRYLSRKL